MFSYIIYYSHRIIPTAHPGGTIMIPGRELVFRRGWWSVSTQLLVLREIFILFFPNPLLADDPPPPRSIQPDRTWRESKAHLHFSFCSYHLRLSISDSIGKVFHTKLVKENEMKHYTGGGWSLFSVSCSWSHSETFSISIFVDGFELVVGIDRHVCHSTKG